MPTARLLLVRGVALVSLTALPVHSPLAAEPPLREVAGLVGLDFVHDNGMSGRLYAPEILGPGVALFDFDRDGDLDVLVRQGSALAPGVPAGPGSRLFRNDGVEGGFRFVDVTAATEVGRPGYGMGVAVGDVDDDGWPDVYLSNLGADTLLHNRGGRFEDWSGRAPLTDVHWTVPAAFADLDGDGRQDLFVGTYVEFDLRQPGACFSDTSLPDYCGPQSYAPRADLLLLNRGDGRFEDVSAAWGLTAVLTKALGLMVSDVDGDGWNDVFVASDREDNRLWMNQAGKGLVDEGLLRGVAVNGRGEVEGSMGVDLADFDEDGDEDLLISHVRTETNTLYTDDGTGNYTDGTTASALAEPSWPATGFGLGWFDFDGDTDLDLFVTNGLVGISAEQLAAGVEIPLGQRDQLFEQVEPGRFREVPDWSSVSDLEEVGRGLALGDVDGSGTVDVVVANNGGPARLYLVSGDATHHRLAVRPVAATTGGDRVGARIEVRLPDGRRLLRTSRTQGSYASARDPRVFFGLGGATDVEVTVRQGRTRRQIRGVGVDRLLVIPLGGT
jgi:enediyne biosynthesis protein E4